MHTNIILQVGYLETRGDSCFFLSSESINHSCSLLCIPITIKAWIIHHS